MSNPYHQPPQIDPPRPNKSPTVVTPRLWLVAAVLLLIAAPAIFAQQFPLHRFGWLYLRYFLSSISGVHGLLVFMLAAWAPGRTWKRILYASLILAVPVGCLLIGDSLQRPDPAGALIRLFSSVTGYLWAIIPLTALRMATGWRFASPDAEPRLSILDLFGLTALVAVALAVGGLVEVLWDALHARDNVLLLVRNHRITSLIHAVSVLLLAPPVVWLCLRSRPLVALVLIPFAVVASSAVWIIPPLLAKDWIRMEALPFVIHNVLPTKFLTAYLLAVLLWFLQAQGLGLQLGRGGDQCSR